MPLDIAPPRTSRFGSPPGAQPRALGAAGAGSRGQVLDLDRRQFAGQVVYEGLREEAGGRRGSPADRRHKAGGRR